MIKCGILPVTSTWSFNHLTGIIIDNHVPVALILTRHVHWGLPVTRTLVLKELALSLGVVRFRALASHPESLVFAMNQALLVLVWCLVHHILGRIVPEHDMVPFIVVNHRHSWNGMLILYGDRGEHCLLDNFPVAVRVSLLLILNDFSLLGKWFNHGLIGLSYSLVNDWYFSMDNFRLISAMLCLDSFRLCFGNTMHDWLFNHDIVRHLAEIQLLIIYILMVWHCLKNGMLMIVDRLNIMLIVIVMAQLVMRHMVHSMELLKVMFLSPLLRWLRRLLLGTSLSRLRLFLFGLFGICLCSWVHFARFQMARLGVMALGLFVKMLLGAIVVLG